MTAALADTDASIVIGSRNLNQSEDVLPVVGIYAQKSVNNFPVHPELHLLIALDPLYEGSEYDFGIGGIYMLDYQKYNFHLGIGVSKFSANYGDNKSNGSSIYGHSGVSWIINSSYSLGIDIRISSEINSKSNSTNVDNGYFQYAVCLKRLWQ